MKVNSQLRAAIENRGLPVEGIFLFLTAVKYLDDAAVKLLLDKQLLTPEEEDVARIMFLQQNFETGVFTVKQELFEVEESLFNQLFEALINEYHFTSKGHPRNQIDSYAPISNTEEVQDKFTGLVNEIVVKFKDFDLQRLVAVIVNYYLHTEKPKSLANYFQTQAMIDYQSHNNAVAPKLS